MIEVKLTPKELLEIRSTAITNWVNGGRTEAEMTERLIEAFLGMCNKNDYVVINGKILTNYDYKKQRNRS